MNYSEFGRWTVDALQEGRASGIRTQLVKLNKGQSEEQRPNTVVITGRELSLVPVSLVSGGCLREQPSLF